MKVLFLFIWEGVFSPLAGGCLVLLALDSMFVQLANI